MPLPWPGYNLAEGETFRVKVFRDHPEWDKRERWWQMPSHLLTELYVATYECDSPAHLEWVEREYPGHQFIY